MRHVMLVVGLSLCCGLALAEFDLGDLPQCNYPTWFGNPAHTISNKAWLGPCITSEGEGNPLWGDNDACDDGVNFLNLPWMPCEFEQVQVMVTTGPMYSGETLYLNAWKDGNLDGDFCDTLCGGNANEWIIQDVIVTAGTHLFSFVDPGVLNMGVYDGVFRFRLTDQPIGRMGFGQYDPFNCPNMPFCGNFAADSLGEVEDYWLEDAQLDVALNGFEVVGGDNEVRLAWTTASEPGNSHFDIVRNGTSVMTVPAQGSVTSGYSYAWTDRNVTNGTLYTYVLIGVDMNGHREELAVSSATPAPGSLPATYALSQNYPNPFNPSTGISYDLAEAGFVSLRVYNTLGQEVATLVNSHRPAGTHAISFDAAGLPSGLYVYKLTVNGYTDQKKMLLLK